MLNYTDEIASFVQKLSWLGIPTDVQECAKLRMLDTLGVGIFATCTPWGQIITDFARQYGGIGGSALWGKCEKKISPLYAALANGTCAHGFELDDVHYPSISHPGSVIVPAALALAESLSATGINFLESIIVGYEVMGRIGSSIASHHLAKGFHPTGTFGVFGAAAACSKLLDLKASQIQDAMGVAGSFAAGLAQFSVTGSMVKRIHAGQAAESGMKAAILAKQGFTGPREILEGKYGFCRVFNQDPEAIDWNIMMEGLGKRYVVEEISVKPSAACGVLHAVIDCIQQIQSERSFKADDIKIITVLGHENLVHEHNVYKPDSILAAQYSLPFTVGLAVVGRIGDPRVYLDENILRDQKILQIAEKVTTVIDEKIQSAFPKKFGAGVAILFYDGSSMEKKIYDPRGTPEHPFTQNEMEAKFRLMTREIIHEQGIEMLLNKIKNLENVKDINVLFEMVRLQH
ncbi:MAG: MmgE/PrpD family protein [Pseudomonadota bacterium]